jgi:hypothetical protein
LSAFAFFFATIPEIHVTILFESFHFISIFRMEQVVAEPQCDQPRKTVAEAVAEVVQSRTFGEVAGIRPLSIKKTRVTTALQVQDTGSERGFCSGL